MSKYVDLSGRKIVAKGNRRDVYLIDPQEVGIGGANTPLVLKIPRYEERRAHPRLSKRIIAKLFPASLERVIRVEAKYWEHLAASIGADPKTMPVPFFYGYVDTNLGRATLWESVWGADGELAPSISQLELKGGLARAIEPLNRFVAFCFETNIVAPDIRSDNVVLAERFGRTEAVLVDGYGDMRLLSFLSLSPRYNTQFMTRRFARFAWTVGLHFDTETRLFAMPARKP